MLLNPTGGVLGGDHLITEIVQEKETHVCLTTPSATRIYRTEENPAVLETAIHVGEDSTLEYLPDHVIPHAGSALRQSLRVEMERGSRAIILDSFAAGRVARGETLDFFADRFSNRSHRVRQADISQSHVHRSCRTATRTPGPYGTIRLHGLPEFICRWFRGLAGGSCRDACRIAKYPSN